MYCFKCLNRYSTSISIRDQSHNISVICKRFLNASVVPILLESVSMFFVFTVQQSLCKVASYTARRCSMLIKKLAEK